MKTAIVIIILLIASITYADSIDDMLNQFDDIAALSLLTGWHKGSRFNIDGESYVAAYVDRTRNYNQGCQNVTYHYEDMDYTEHTIEMTSIPVVHSFEENRFINTSYYEMYPHLKRLESINRNGYILIPVHIFKRDYPVWGFLQGSGGQGPCPDNPDNTCDYVIFHCQQTEFFMIETWFVVKVAYNPDFPECSTGECFEPADIFEEDSDPNQLICDDVIATIDDFSYVKLFNCFIERMKTTEIFQKVEEISEVPTGGSSVITINTENYGDHSFNFNIFSSGYDVLKGFFLLVSSWIALKIILRPTQNN